MTLGIDINVNTKKHDNNNGKQGYSQCIAEIIQQDVLTVDQVHQLVSIAVQLREKQAYSDKV